MTWFQILAQAGVMASILSIGVAVAAYLNGRHIKAGISEIRDLIAKEAEGTKAILERIDQRAEERHREVLRFFIKKSKKR